MCNHGGVKPAGRSTLEVGEIFRRHGPAYRRKHKLTPGQLRVMGDIETCRTAIRGGHLDTCDHCGFQVPAYDSCGNRHCPKCQAFHQAKWIHQRIARILPTTHFHVVFTLPKQLRSLALCNRKLIYNLLFKKASETLLELTKDTKHLGGMVGITAVLHSWTRQLGFHPHLHCLVTAGGLNSLKNQWVDSDQNFLLPVKVLSRLFRGKFLCALKNLYNQGLLKFFGGCSELADPKAFRTLIDQLYQQEWVAYAKRPFAKSEHVFEYLGRYTHRVAISNQRLISAAEDGITFATKQGKRCTLQPEEFIRRFLLHVLPARFVKIRHYGLYASSCVKTKLEQSRRLLADRVSIEENPSDQDNLAKQDISSLSFLAIMLLLTQIDLSICPRCGIGRMKRTCLLPFEAYHQSKTDLSVTPDDTS